MGFIVRFVRPNDHRTSSKGGFSGVSPVGGGNIVDTGHPVKGVRRHKRSGRIGRHIIPRIRADIGTGDRHRNRSCGGEHPPRNYNDSVERIHSLICNNCGTARQDFALERLGGWSGCRYPC
ncbi:MAG: hypothetical protein ACFFCW_30400 [Candidatus Hodarchaeota archaeon]